MAVSKDARCPCKLHSHPSCGGSAQKWPLAVSVPSRTLCKRVNRCHPPGTERRDWHLMTPTTSATLKPGIPREEAWPGRDTGSQVSRHTCLAHGEDARPPQHSAGQQVVGRQPLGWAEAAAGSTAMGALLWEHPGPNFRGPEHAHVPTAQAV